MMTEGQIADIQTGWRVPCRVRKLADSESSEREWYVLANVRATPSGEMALSLPHWIFDDGRGVFLEEVAGQYVCSYVNIVRNMMRSQ